MKLIKSKKFKTLEKEICSEEIYNKNGLKVQVKIYRRYKINRNKDNKNDQESK